MYYSELCKQSNHEVNLKRYESARLAGKSTLLFAESAERNLAV
jgi:hypothetical protein